EQMDYLTPELLRILKPGRVAAIHVKDRVLYGNVTGTGMPTIDPFSDLTTAHFMKHGFQYMGRITVVTDVVRENNQTYRLGWTEQCKDGTKMGIGCPEYILLFRKLPTDTTRAYADNPVVKSKDDYTRARWQIDAHSYWRSSGNRLALLDELKEAPVSDLQARYREFSRNNVYDYTEHVTLAEDLEEENKLPSSFMVVAPGSHSQWIWDDVNRMRTLNSEQSRKELTMHICPLQFDIVERIIQRFSNQGEAVLDPFGGLMTVPYMAVKMGRKGYGIELNRESWKDGCRYLKDIETEITAPTLFDLEAMQA
ncbi:MAG: DNA methylase N-4, partial [Tannerella sp.]|nr:DNA methylase N-4 [Tannerella sp.]